MQKLVFVLAAVALALAGAEKNFQDYKVFQVTPKDDEQTSFLHYLAENSRDYDFWSGPSVANQSAHIMVAPDNVKDFERLMNIVDFTYDTYIENVQELINNEKTRPLGSRLSTQFDWKSYHDLDEIYKFLDQLAVQYPENVEVVVAGKTYEGRQIKGVKVTFKENNPGIFIEGGIHAREWISPATVTYILHQLLTSKDSDVRDLAENNDWYIFPVFNPDGYTYTHSSDLHRLWRKSRSPNGMCKGVDLNRNWGYKWMQGGASSYPCAETYAGKAEFSEPETATVSKYISSIAKKIYTYISFHSYSQLLLFPYGHTKEHLDNYSEMYGVGKKAIDALAKRFGTSYTLGNIAETIYIATGSTVDWVKGVHQVPLSYTYELRDKGRYGFLLPPNLIIPTADETLDSLVALFQEARRRGIAKPL